MVDFGKLSRPKAGTASTDPIDIFKRTPNLGHAPNELWRGQAAALESWHRDREKRDNLIILNTGAGKSIVGILVAQSLVNENIGPVVYTCATIDLVQQTAHECDKIGLKYSTRVGSKFSNDSFATGKSFCITTYQALFTPRSAFQGEKTPAGVIFDDAHVSERIIRDSFTLTVTKKDFPELYSELVSILKTEFESIRKSDHLKAILEESATSSVTLAPPGAANRSKNQLLDALKRHHFRDYPELLFPTLQLYENIGVCAIFISSSAIEIAPPFIPVKKFPFLSGQTRRVYLSATLDYETDFVRAFGMRKVNRIEPDNDAGKGERLILMGSDLSDPNGKINLSQKIAEKRKVLISVPSYQRAGEWAKVAVPPVPAKFSAELESFRNAKSGAFCLVSRVDGIDLPQDTCRVMIVDGSPSGQSLMERFQMETLQMHSLFATKVAGRITQLFGRINRGRSDFGAFIVYGNDANEWLRNERNRALLPSLLRKQVMLGETVQKDSPPLSNSDVVGLVKRVIDDREKPWLEFYRDTIDGLEVSLQAIEVVKDRESKLSIGAEAECSFMSHLWDGDWENARRALLNVVDDVALVDPKLAGWYSLWLGMSYELEADSESFGPLYERARSRLSHKLNVPFTRKFETSAKTFESTSPIHLKLLETNRHGPKAINDLIAKIRLQLDIVRNRKNTSGQHEEAVRMLGELLGFETSRPDNELGDGPDVTWFDSEAKLVGAFELKTLKEAPAKYKKDEVGQCLSHIEWIKANFPDYTHFGITLFGPDGTRTKNASAGERVFFLTESELRSRVNLFLSRLEDSVGRVDLDRWAMLNEVGGSPEWQLTGWFSALNGKRFDSLPTE